MEGSTVDEEQGEDDDEEEEQEEEPAPPPPPPPPPSSSSSSQTLTETPPEIAALLPKEYGYAYLEAFDPAPFPVADVPAGRGFLTLQHSNSKYKYYMALQEMHKVARDEAVRLGLVDAPGTRKRLEDVITIKGVCMQMCPLENAVGRDVSSQLLPWERTPDGKVDFTRAVKNYERAMGDRVHPMDIRPPPVLVKTLDYLFGVLMQQHGVKPTYRFISDRGRSIRNDLTIQHVHDATAISIHMRIARFHILALHVFQGHEPYTYRVPPFEVTVLPLERHYESEQLANTLLSVKEFLENQTHPLEMEFWVYDRLWNIGEADDQRENVPEAVKRDKIFILCTRFRREIQAAQPSREIFKNKKALWSAAGKLSVSDRAMAVFGELVVELRSRRGVRVMMYLLACLVEHWFGVDKIEEIEAIRGGLTDLEVVDGREPEEQIAEEEEEEPQVVVERIPTPVSATPTTSIFPSTPFTLPPTPQPSSSIFHGGIFSTPLAPTSGGIFSTPLAPPHEEPPALARRAPISLPSTPTVREAPSRVPTPPSTPGPASLFGPALTNNTKDPDCQHSAQLPVWETRGELSPLVMSRGDSPLKGFESPIKTAFDGKGKAPERPYTWPVIAPQPVPAPVPVQLTTTPDSSDEEEETPWQEAVRKGEAYHAKVRPRISRGNKLRVRKPQPGYRTDEELARRFEQNHTSHVKRWARGTFLAQLKPPTDMPWDVWLALNEDREGTAIWIEDKFTPEHQRKRFVPFEEQSGGVVVVETAGGAPGLIVFECTPLGGVEDELERGYAALDDLTRLRAVLALLRAGQSTYRYVPAVVVVLWEGGAVENEVRRMLDKEFAAALSEVTLDWVGARGRFMDAKTVWRVFSRDVEALVTEYLAYCSGDGVNYSLYATLVSAVVDLVRGISAHTSVLLAKEEEEPPPLFAAAHVEDDEAMYDAALAWRAGAELEQYRALGKAFPTRAFLDHIVHIPLRPPPYPRHFVFHHVLAERKALFEAQVDRARTRLVRARTVRRRRTSSVVGKWGCEEVSVVSLSPPLNGHALSTRDGSVETEEESGRVTVAMLRALTRDVRARYSVGAGL
ncbi:hypothetical protein BDZ89DRAFT_1058411 [Hymenopellis radicata]|nr:hypothetical protein BDZ89DRAFT_1058411 [Hymenopellis radicata]